MGHVNCFCYNSFFVKWTKGKVVIVYSVNVCVCVCVCCNHCNHHVRAHNEYHVKDFCFLVLQLIKSRVKEQKLGVMFDSNVRKDYIFTSMQVGTY